MKMRRGVGAVLLQTWECLGLAEPGRGLEGSPAGMRGRAALLTLISRFKNSERIHFCCPRTPSLQHLVITAFLALGN